MTKKSSFYLRTTLSLSLATALFSGAVLLSSRRGFVLSLQRPRQGVYSLPSQGGVRGLSFLGLGTVASAIGSGIKAIGKGTVSVAKAAGNGVYSGAKFVGKAIEAVASSSTGAAVAGAALSAATGGTAGALGAVASTVGAAMGASVTSKTEKKAETERKKYWIWTGIGSGIAAILITLVAILV